MENKQCEIKGIFLKGIVDLVAKEKGSEGLDMIRQKIGTTSFSTFKDYPLEIQAKLHQLVGELLYGRDSDIAQRKIGEHIFKMYAETLIGKTIFSLMGNDIKKIALEAGRTSGTIFSSLQLKTEDLGGNKVRLTFSNFPFHVQYMVGVLESAAAAFHLKDFSLVSRVISEGNYEYLAEWH